MSKKLTTHSSRHNTTIIEIKSKFDAEFRRWSMKRNDQKTFDDFHTQVKRLHHLANLQFLISYIDPRDNDLLPINNDDNFGRAITIAKPLLRIIIQRKGDGLEDFTGYGTIKPRNIISSILGQTPVKGKSLAISNPHDFRQVSAIIDVDIVPETHRRVRLLKHGSDKPLGFYIRDGTSFRVTSNGLEKQPGIFISRLVPGGLAESTGLLAVNDEVLEVNGIEVAGKTLDQVTDMMVANSSNLIITVKPANQRTLAAPRRGSFSRNSQVSSGSQQSQHTNHTNTSDEIDNDDQDEVVDLTGVTLELPQQQSQSQSQPQPQQPSSSSTTITTTTTKTTASSSSSSPSSSTSIGTITTTTTTAITSSTAAATNEINLLNQKDGVLHV